MLPVRILFTFRTWHMEAFERGTVVVLTHNHRARLLQTLRGLACLPEGWPVIVVDNGSTDGTAKAVSREFPRVMLIRSRRNIGAAARNIAVAYAHTPYVAFCDDDCLWQAGALQRAANIMDDNPDVGVVSGCILEGERGRVHPDCAEMARSPLDRENLPGPQLLGFMTDACVVRIRAFYEAGGFWPPLFVGGEESLLALDMAVRGWRLIYMDDVLIKRTIPAVQTSMRKRCREFRNNIWVAWMRLPVGLAWRETLRQLRMAAQARQLRVVVMLTLTGMMRALQRRQVISPRVAAMLAKLHAHSMARADDQASQSPRRSMV